MKQQTTVNDYLRSSTKLLQDAGIATARLDCLVLMEDYMNKNRTQLLAHPELKIDNEQLMYLWSAVDRRIKHEPLAYIRGKTEFYGREFIINKYVLEPRPESEAMIDLLKAAVAIGRLPRPRIADIGAGSGALGITAKLELPDAQVDLIEIDASALTVAKKNVNKFSVNATCTKRDLFTHAASNYDVVLANLPYVPDNFHINSAALMEPRIAIFGGPDGLDVYRRLFAQLNGTSSKPSLVFTEALPPQHSKLTNIARLAGYDLAKTEDFIQQFVLGPKK